MKKFGSYFVTIFSTKDIYLFIIIIIIRNDRELILFFLFSNFWELVYSQKVSRIDTLRELRRRLRHDSANGMHLRFCEEGSERSATSAAAYLPIFLRRLAATNRRAQTLTPDPYRGILV